tara:strand:- start:308 stop:562 length:255 start_codon:yes stop_codon:yes gene_type:complete
MLVDCSLPETGSGGPLRCLQRRLAMPAAGGAASTLSLRSSQTLDEVKDNDPTSEDATTGREGGSVSGVAMVESEAALTAGLSIL